MALLFADSFDHYTTTEITDKWTTITNQPTIDTGTYRNGGRSLAASGNNRFVHKTVASSAGPYIWGAAYWFSATAAADQAFLAFREGTTTHIDLRITTTSLLRVTRAGTTLGTGTTALANATWYYVEIKLTINDTTGAITVRLNGTNEIVLTNQDTRNGGTGIIDNYLMGIVGNDNGAAPRIDDHVFLDTTGSAPNNDFLGDVVVECLFPNGNGNSSQFDGSDGNQIDNYLLVDDVTPDDDTTYVQSPDIGDKDTYAYTNLVTTSGTVFGVQPVPRFRKTDAGSVTANSVARLSGTETDSAAKMVLDNYVYSPDVRETKPGGGVWTITDVNNAEFGLKVAS